MFQLRRLFEWQGILQFKPKRRFFIRQCFFSFTIHCCFMAILKTSADTNAGQSRSLTHCIKKSTSYKELEIHVNQLASYIECCSSGRIFCSLRQSGFSIDSVFFFHCSLRDKAAA